MNALPDSADGLAILLWASEPEAPHRLVTPFFHAAAAAAFDLPVEVYFSARSVRLLVPGVAAGLHASATHEGTVYDTMREAVAHGAVFYACSDALQAHGLADAELPPNARGAAVRCSSSRGRRTCAGGRWCSEINP